MWRLFCVSAVACGLAGCAHLGEAMGERELPPGAPPVQDILDGLAANDAAIASFRATGKFTLKAAELDTIYLLPVSSIYFRRPADLYVVGRKHGVTAVRLLCVGEKFLIEFPTEKEYYHRETGERFSSVAEAVSPIDIVEEMFLPESWAELRPECVAMTDFDATAGEAVLEVYEKPGAPSPVRRLWVRGSPWVVVRNERLGEDGLAVAVTEKLEYHVLEGLRFPTIVDSQFPGEAAWMRFEMRKITLNEEISDEQFDLAGRVAELRRRGHAAITPEERKGQTR